MFFKVLLKATIAAFQLLHPFEIQTQTVTWSAADLICHYCLQLLVHVLSAPHMPHQLCYRDTMQDGFLLSKKKKNKFFKSSSSHSVSSSALYK